MNSHWNAPLVAIESCRHGDETVVQWTFGSWFRLSKGLLNKAPHRAPFVIDDIDSLVVLRTTQKCASTTENIVFLYWPSFPRTCTASAWPDRPSRVRSVAHRKLWTQCTDRIYAPCGTLGPQYDQWQGCFWPDRSRNFHGAIWEYQGKRGCCRHVGAWQLLWISYVCII